MDPVVREFMQRIMWSLFAALTWLMINAVAGLRYELALIDGTHTTGTALFYIWFSCSSSSKSSGKTICNNYSLTWHQESKVPL
ncbi:MAG: hypothetical protein RLZZ390_1255 [Bacteroidota bacterium]